MFPQKLKIKCDKSRNSLFKIEKNKPFHAETGVICTPHSITIDNTEYVFDNFDEYSIISPKFTGYFINGEQKQVNDDNSYENITSTLLWKAKINNFDVTLGTNEHSTIEFLDLFDEVNRSTTTFVPSSTATKWMHSIKGGVHRNLGQAYTSFQDITDIDAKNMSYSMTYSDSAADSTVLSPYYKADKPAHYNIEGSAESQIGNVDNYYHGTFDKLLNDNICAWYRQIDVAVAFDSSFVSFIPLHHILLIISHKMR